MNNPILMSQYAMDRQQETLKNAEVYWQPRSFSERQGESTFDKPRRTPPLRRLAHVVTTLFS